MQSRLLPLLFTLLIFLGNLTLAKTQNIDSLEQLVRSNAHDTIKFDALKTLSNASRRSDVDKSINYANELLRLSKLSKNYFYIGTAYNLLAIRYRYKNFDLDTIISTSQKSLVFAEKANSNLLKAMSYNTMALAYKKAGQTEKAFSLYQQAFKIFDEVGNKGRALRTLGNMAILMKQNEDLEAAKDYYLKAIRYAGDINDEVMASRLGHNLANILVEQNEIDSALILYNKALAVNRAVNNDYFVALSLANIGRIKIEQKQYEIAYQYLIESYEITKGLGDFYIIGIAFSALSEYYFDRKNYNKTIDIAKEALEILGENGDISTRKEFYKKLSDSYEAKGNFTLAFKNQKIYHTLSDSIYNIQKVLQINNLKIENEVTQKEMENSQLKMEKEANEKTIQNRNLIALALCLGLLLLGSWGFSVYRSRLQTRKHNERLEEQVKARTSELQTANKNLEQANYELRTFNYIASHDIKEPIRVIGGYAGLIQKQLPQDLKEKFGNYFSTIKRSTKQLYTLVEDFAYYSTLSKDESIQKAPIDLKLLTTNVRDNLKESITRYNGTVIIHDLPTINSSSTFLFTALKNLIENGLKYNESEKPTVAISYAETDTHHQITVRDNGIGIDKKYHEQIFEMFKRLHNRGAYEGSGIGLAIVKLAVEKLEGTVKIESEMETGTSFVLNLPK